MILCRHEVMRKDNDYHKGTYSPVTLIWNPVGSLDVGAELSYGWLQSNNAPQPMLPRIQFTGSYRFVKHEQE